MEKKEYDAIVVGSGPNGLAAAITMQQQGLSVLLIEGKKEIGGGLRSAELTLPGFVHDICSAIHPMAAASPFFKTLPLAAHGLEYIHPDIAAAHPFDDGTAAILCKSVAETAFLLGADQQAYLDFIRPVLKDWTKIDKAVLGPLISIPSHPVAMAKFGLQAMTSALTIAKKFKTKEAKGLWAGMAAHSMQPLSSLTTSAIGIVLMAVGHLGGWPIPKGGSQEIANALASYFISLGGKIQTAFFVKSLRDLPSAHAVLFDVSPRQLLEIAGHRFSSIYKWQLEKYRYGMGVFKIDWALADPVPFTAEGARKAGTVHLGNSIEEITVGEYASSIGAVPEKPFVLFAQPSVFDPGRAPEGKHTAWAYCHVPHGSAADMTTVIENQVERFAPGFKERILAKHTFNPAELEAYNPNYIGGDINGGIIDISQIFNRPALGLSPYGTSEKGIYICSASTPPGGGVHGMCGYHAAKRALKEVFNLNAAPLF